MLRYIVLIVLVRLSLAQGATKRVLNDGEYSENSLNFTNLASNDLCIRQNQEITAIPYVCLPVLTEKGNGWTRPSTSISTSPPRSKLLSLPVGSKAVDQDNQARPPPKIPSQLTLQLVPGGFQIKKPSSESNRDATKPYTENHDLPAESASSESSDDGIRTLNSKVGLQKHLKQGSNSMDQDDQARTPNKIPPEVVYQLVSDIELEKPSSESSIDATKPYTGNHDLPAESASSESSEDGIRTLNSKVYLQERPKLGSNSMDQDEQARPPIKIPPQLTLLLVPGGLQIKKPSSDRNMDAIKPYTENHDLSVESASSESSEDDIRSLNSKVSKDCNQSPILVLSSSNIRI
ncbi:uncharacterized protein [Fopius arisanus]|uniref:Uncharacterized protein isoform X1 n=1 Tax=Fopius arisanus TaxID=64838 RepID=A0A9R1T1R3_9HYME|nr:PREDICTED: uncharacterized protein LOC105265476 isoform X1 [Fopius arisanus]